MRSKPNSLIWPALLACLAFTLLPHTTGGAEKAELFKNLRFIPLTAYEVSQTDVQRAETFSDRLSYWSDDGQGQFLVVFIGYDIKTAGAKIKLELAGDSSTLGAKEIELGKPDQTPKLAFFVDTNALKPGAYSLRATLLAADGATTVAAKACQFTRVEKSRPSTPIPPEGIPLQVQPQTHIDSAAWPITTGVPMPFGTLTDASKLVLLEDGKPVPAQWTTRATWTPGEPTSIKWLGLDFLARYEGGKPKDYRIQVGAAAASPASVLTVTETAETITVDTGVIRLEVNRKRFTGIETAWLDLNADGKFTDNERVIQAPKPPTGKESLGVAPAGPFIVDCRGIRYEASNDLSPEVRIEEKGPVRVTILARGWYTNNKVSEKAGRQLCQFVTRLTAHAGQPTVQINERTVITYDTRLNKLTDVAFAVPMPGAEKWSLGMDGKPFEGTLPDADKSVWLHQERWDHARLMDGNNAVPKAEGKKSDGWLAVSAASAIVTGFLRDIWQKFPKELEADRTGITFHFWPQHGRRVFKQEEEIARANIYKLWFAHQGRALDLQLPSTYFDQLMEWDAQKKWDVEDTAAYGYASNGQGLAIGNDFCVTLQGSAPKSDDITRQSRLYQQNPHAMASPSWNVSTLVEGVMAARDDKRWPEIERYLNGFYPTCMLNIVEHGTEYGMWIYANTHNGWELPNNYAPLHRVWNNTHYRQVWTPWILYFRGGPLQMLQWARANTDNLMDVATVNYADPKNPMKYHTPGGMYHVKGFVPWGAPPYGMASKNAHGGVWGHWIGPDAFLIRYCIEGNLRAWDLYRMWGSSLGSMRLPYGPGREGVNTFGEILNYYQATWDPQAIMYNHDFAEAMLNTPFDKFMVSPVWHKTWLDRCYDLTRDERTVKGITEYIAKGPACDNPGPNAFAWRATQNKSYLTRLMPHVYDTVRHVYSNPADPLNGFAAYVSAARTPFMQQLPYYLGALQAAGITAIERGGNDTGTYPIAGTHLYSQTQRREIGLYIHALDPDDRPFKVKIETADGHDTMNFDILVFSPSGKMVGHFIHDYQQDKTLRFTGDTVKHLEIPKDGEKGVYTIECIGAFGSFAMIAPVTDMPHEIASFPKGSRVKGVGRQMGYLGLPPKSSATVTFKAANWYNSASPACIHIDGSDGKPLLDTSLLDGSQRTEVSVDLKSGDKTQAWPIDMICQFGPFIQWSGETPGVYFSCRADDFEPIFKAMTTHTSASP